MASLEIERRRDQRVEVRLPALVEGDHGRDNGTLSVVSSTGCFVHAVSKVVAGDLVRLEVELPTGESISVWGEVVHHSEGVGFALRFTKGDEFEQQMIGLLVDYARK